MALQTLSEYLDNPMGKGSTAIANRGLIRFDLEKRYDKLIQRYKDFDHTLWYDGDDFYIHLKIPSETERENTYDVVIMLTPDGDKGIATHPTFKDHYIKVFSNCPSFVYTYAYVYHKNGMLIDFLEKKYTDITLSDNPEIKNPGQVINYDKSIFFACYYIMQHKSILTKLTWAGRSKKLGKRALAANIRETDTILLEIKKEEQRIKKDKIDKLNKSVKKLQSPIKKTKERDADKNKRQAISSTPKKQKITPRKKITAKSKIKPR